MLYEKSSIPDTKVRNAISSVYQKHPVKITWLLIVYFISFYFTVFAKIHFEHPLLNFQERGSLLILDCKHKVSGRVFAFPVFNNLVKTKYKHLN